MTEQHVRELVAAYRTIEANPEVLNVFTYGCGFGYLVMFDVLSEIGPVTFSDSYSPCYPYLGSVTIDGVRFHSFVTQDDYDHYTAAASPATA